MCHYLFNNGVSITEVRIKQLGTNLTVMITTLQSEFLNNTEYYYDAPSLHSIMLYPKIATNFNTYCMLVVLSSIPNT